MSKCWAFPDAFGLSPSRRGPERTDSSTSWPQMVPGTDFLGLILTLFGSTHNCEAQWTKSKLNNVQGSTMSTSICLWKWPWLNLNPGTKSWQYKIQLLNFQTEQKSRGVQHKKGKKWDLDDLETWRWERGLTDFLTKGWIRRRQYIYWKVTREVETHENTAEIN